MGIMTSGRVRGRWGRRVALSLTTILASGLAAPAFAQAPTATKPLLDANGVDLATGKFSAASKTVAAGDLQFSDVWAGAVDGTTFTNVVYVGALNAAVYVDGKSIKFALIGDDYFPEIVNGATLVNDGSGHFIYTAPDSTKYEFTTSEAGAVGVGPQPQGSISSWLRLSQITKPNGETRTWNYRLEQTHSGSCTLHFGIWGGSGCVVTNYQRVQSITSNRGYMLKPAYLSDTAGSDFNQLTSVKAIDLSVDYCDPTADSCASLTQSWPTLSISYNTAGTGLVDRTFTMTDDWRVRLGINGPTEGDVDSTGNLDFSITYYTDGRLHTLSHDGITYTYTYSQTGTDLTVTVTTNTGITNTYEVALDTVRVENKTDGRGYVTSYEYDADNRLFRTTYPEGNKLQQTYDSLGRVTEVRQKPKSGTGLSDITATATYDSGCTPDSLKYCMSPLTTVDPDGNQTDYTYSTDHGGVTKVQFAASASGQPRGEIDYGYTSLYAQIRNSSGTLVNAGSPVWKLTSVTQCATAATCSGSANESKVTVSYGPNLLPSQVTTAAGDNSISSTVSYAYDNADNVVSVDGPLSGTDDTTYYFYDAEKRVIGVISPDPDGAGPLKRRAVRYTYTNGLPVSSQIGTATGTDSTALAGMTVAQEADTTFDANGRPSVVTNKSGGTAYSLTQLGYNSDGRVECEAVRMNSATWASLPSSACSLATTGSFGPDRITKNTYDADGNVTLVQSGYGVSGVQADEVATSYTANGRTASVTDAEGNKTSYTYDGMDRLSKTAYPNTGKGNGSSSSTDYELVGYDTVSNLVVSRQLRDGNSIAYTYDHLNRLTAKNLPGSEPDVSYTYDLLGRMTGASQTGNALTFGYDALSRNTSQGGPLGTVSYQYDAANRRTRTTWPDTFYVSYDHLVTGEATVIRENGASTGVGVLATYAYDDLGRRTSLTYGNGTVTSYAFDNVSRLASLGTNLDGSTATNDVTTYLNYSPASQVASQNRTNDLYAWDGHFNVGRSYTSNGLNQYTAIGGTTPSYDARGNMTGSVGGTYGYSSENLLTSATVSSVSLTFAYDPMLRLYQEAGTTTARFMYDGSDMIAEANGSNVMQKRYVFGPGTDEPLVEYSGSGTGTGVRTFLHADERGSIVARSNESGAKTAINSYDEYGIPYSGNTGRFQYTGQAWLAQLGMYYYKARIYSPTHGRFMQTDLIGYADGMNWYNYVGSDPVNQSDTLGLGTGIGKLKEKLSRDIIQVIGSYGSGGYTAPVMHAPIGATTTGNTTWSDAEGITLVGKRCNIICQLGAGLGYLQDLGHQILCRAPALAGTFGTDFYEGVGGSLGTGGSFNPRNGQISLSFDLGVGVGWGEAVKGEYVATPSIGLAKADTAPSPVVTAGLNLNGNLVGGTHGVTGSVQLLGANPGDVSGGYVKGEGATANANISAHIQVNLPALYDLRCATK